MAFTTTAGSYIANLFESDLEELLPSHLSASSWSIHCMHYCVNILRATVQCSGALKNLPSLSGQCYLGS
jgi:hypothetical protein